MLKKLRNVRGKTTVGRMRTYTNGTIKINAPIMNTSEKRDAIFKPKTFTKVLVPTVQSASASKISFVVVPPKRNRAATQPVANGSGSKGFPNTLQEPRIPRNPRGRATHTWLRNKNFFMRGASEYVIEKKAIRDIKKPKRIWTVMERSNAIAYKKNES